MNAPDPLDPLEDRTAKHPAPPPPSASGFSPPPAAPGGYAPPAGPAYPSASGPYAGAAPAQHPPVVQPPGPYAPGAQPPGPYAPHQYAPGPYPAQPSNGTLSWALGFLIFIPIPFLSAIISGIAMAVPYSSLSRRGPVAAANARAAANWGLTYLTVSTVLLLAHFIVLAAFAGDEGMEGFFPIGIAITLYLVLGVLHIVLVIIGTVRSSGGKVMRVPFAIPYVRG